MPISNRLSAAGVALFGNTGVANSISPFGLGDQLCQQIADEIEEEPKQRALGLSVLSPGGSAAAHSLPGSMSLGGYGGGLP
jgi:hypothetical protein